MPVDVFTIMAASVGQKCPEDVSPEERHLALRYYHGYLEATRFHQLPVPQLRVDDRGPVVLLEQKKDGTVSQVAGTEPVSVLLLHPCFESTSVRIVNPGGERGDTPVLFLPAPLPLQRHFAESAHVAWSLNP